MILFLNTRIAELQEIYNSMIKYDGAFVFHNIPFWVQQLKSYFMILFLNTVAELQEIYNSMIKYDGASVFHNITFESLVTSRLKSYFMILFLNTVAFFKHGFRSQSVEPKVSVL
jgi:hypothetical protein